MQPRATKLESSNITQLVRAVHNGDTITSYHEWTWYSGRKQARDTQHDFQVYGTDLDTGETWEVVGEKGYDWTEVHEVATVFNDDQDGVFYYVGDSESPDPIQPSYAELQEFVGWAVNRLGTFFDAPLASYSYSERVAAYVLWGQNPRYFVNAWKD